MELKDIVFGYKKPFLQIPYLKIEKGKFYAIVGPNGAGKTTLLRLMGGVIKPWEGTVLLNGKKLPYEDRKSIAMEIALVLQRISWDVNLSVYDIVSMGRYPYRGSSADTKHDIEAIYDAMHSMGITNLIDRRFSELSDGEKQRVLIARALAQEPEFLLLDEPISHLDIYHQVGLLELLKEIAAKGVAIVAVLHELNMAGWFSDCILLMNKGRIVDEGIAESVLTETRIKDIFGIEVKKYLFDNKPILIPSAIVKDKVL